MARTTTTTEVTNRALRIIGESSADQLVNVETDSGEIADVCRQFLEYSTREIQATCRWDELVVRATLPTPIEDLTENYNYRWAYAYDLPDDYIQPVWQDERDYEIEGNRILCNWSKDFIFYYYKYSADPTEWQPQLLKCITHKLALSLCIPITENEKKYQMLLQEYEQVIKPEMERTASYAKKFPNSRWKRQNWSETRGMAYNPSRGTMRGGRMF